MMHTDKVIDIRAKRSIIYQTHLSIDKLQDQLLYFKGWPNEEVKRIQAAADECERIYRSDEYLTYSEWCRLYERVDKLRDYEEALYYGEELHLPDKI